MRYVVDSMQLGDIPRVADIEKRSAPAPWPSSAYRRELQDNKLARYVVVRDTLLSAVQYQEPVAPEPRRVPFPMSLFARKPAPLTGRTAELVGFAGLWLMVDEAHITNIAVLPEYRGRGLGELLLINLIDIASSIGARWVTLEVRVSNLIAQNLYQKYSFRQTGMRHRYYSDNNEDALIMGTSEINAPTFLDNYARLRHQLQQKLDRDRGDIPMTTEHYQV